MKRFRALATIAAVAALSIPAAAQHGPTNAHIPAGAGGGHIQGPSSHGGDAGEHGGATTHGSSASTHGSSGDHGRHAPSTSSGTTTTTNTSTSNPIADSISKNPKQLARLTAMLPNGMTLEDASSGFRNRGQFIAALEVSKNRGIAFTDLKNAMTQDGLSLGEAVRKLQPGTKTADNETADNDNDKNDTAPKTGTTTPTTGTTTSGSTSGSTGGSTSGSTSGTTTSTK